MNESQSLVYGFSIATWSSTTWQVKEAQENGAQAGRTYDYMASAVYVRQLSKRLAHYPGCQLNPLPVSSQGLSCAIRWALRNADIQRLCLHTISYIALN